MGAAFKIIKKDLVLKPNVTLITNYPVSYRIDFFNELSCSNDVNVNFVFISKKSDSRTKKKISEYKNERFTSKSTFYEGSGRFLIIQLFKKLKSEKSDIVIIGGFPIYFISVILCKFFFKTKIVCWWGGTVLINGSRNKLETFYRKVMASFLDGGLYYSKLAQDYLKRLNKNLKYEFVLGNNTRNSKEFYNKVIQSKNIEESSEKVFVLTVGALNESKNTKLILEALNSDVFLKENVEVLIVGEGDELERLKLFSKDNSIKCQFLGHVTPKEIVRYYKKASVFVHPSKYDRWPQVYNEAISAGLPTLVSNRSEVYDEYTNTYYNEVVFNAYDYKELSKKLKYVIQDKALKNKLSKFALKVAFENDGIAKMKSFNEFLLSIK